MSDPITEKQGEEIIELLEKIVEMLEEIKNNTSTLLGIEVDLDRIEKNVLQIAIKD